MENRSENNTGNTPKYSHKNVILLFIAQAIALTSTITIVTYSALVGKMLSGSTSLASIPAAAGLIAAALTAYPASIFMNKYGRKRGFQLGAIFALLSGICAFYGIYMENFLIFVLGIFQHGIFQSFSAFYRFAAMEVTPRPRHKQAVSYVLAGGIFAAMIAPTAAHFFDEIFFLPLQNAGVYILVIVLSFLSQFVLFFASFLDHNNRNESQSDSQKVVQEVQKVVQEVKPTFKSNSKPSLWNILKRPVFLCACLNAAGGYLIMSYVMTSSPIEIVNYCGFQVGDAASVIQWHAMFMFLPAFFCGSLIARVGPVKVIFMGMACFAIAAIFATLGLKLINFYVTMIMVGLGWNFMFTAGTILLEQAYSPSEKAHVQGINDFVVYGLTASSTLSSGYMLETLGWHNMNLLVFGVLGLLFVITLWYVMAERKRLEFERI